WRSALERRGMKVSHSKTEYMCVNEREGSGIVRLQGEEVKKVQEFKYLGSTVQSNGECGKEHTDPLVRHSKPVLKLVQTCPEGAISAFECTDWDMFRETATNGDTTDLEEYTSSVSSYISKCIDDVTISKSITTRSNQKLWMAAKVRALLKSRDSELETRMP
ncbi:hypothetical protein QTP70_014085, partial [Hemibagrus guttatus]